MKTLYNWTEAGKVKGAKGEQVNYRKVVAYAALSATGMTDETYEEFKRYTSGHVNPWSYRKHIEMKKAIAVELWNGAVRNGFIDC